MKKLNLYIQESILDDDEDIDNKKLIIQPKSKEELINIIKDSLNNGITDFNFIDISKILGLDNLFWFCKSEIKDNNITEINLSDWNVSKVTSMYEMFDFCDTLEKIDISNWKTTYNLNNMAYMFYNCEKLKEIKGIENLNVSEVRNMSSMFYNCKNFNQDISNWKLDNVTSIQEMFKKCFKFDQDLSKWEKYFNKPEMYYAINTKNVFTNSKLEKENKLPKWYKCI